MYANFESNFFCIHGQKDLQFFLNTLKVSKFQKQIFMISFEPKNEQNYFLISALASKNGWNQKNEGIILY